MIVMRAYTPSREPTIESSGGAIIQPDRPKRFVVAAGSVRDEPELLTRVVGTAEDVAASTLEATHVPPPSKPFYQVDTGIGTEAFPWPVRQQRLDQCPQVMVHDHSQLPTSRQ
ncbi:hypothetical protein AB0478_46440 [Streptomyces sp. NPDC051917]|uniref:hypothetical protein n=1 Tax=Streptomyces sp. NPDC051917 TaxID=3154754 RepID=UPI003451D97A